jgi:HSP20 family protein
MSYIATWVDPFLKDLLQRSEGGVQPERRETLPAADVWETPEAWLIVLNMPGVERSGVELEMAGGSLTVTGRPAEFAPEGGASARRERATGPFQRSFNLDETQVDAAQITAAMKDGVLKVRLPKAGPAKTHRIEVKEA